MQENGGLERGFLLDMIKIIVGSERNGEEFKNGENYISGRDRWLAEEIINYKWYQKEGKM